MQPAAQCAQGEPPTSRKAVMLWVLWVTETVTMWVLITLSRLQTFCIRRDTASGDAVN